MNRHLSNRRDPFRVVRVEPTGPTNRPFDKLQVSFSQPRGAADRGPSSVLSVTPRGQPVCAASFTVATLTQPSTLHTQPLRTGGTMVPRSLNQITPDHYEIDPTGLTGQDNYSLTVGPDILSAKGQALDQNEAGSPGDASPQRGTPLGEGPQAARFRRLTPPHAEAQSRSKFVHDKLTRGQPLRRWPEDKSPICLWFPGGAYA